MYEIFEKLCAQHGITPYKFCKDTGVRTSTISSWKVKETKCGAKLAAIVCDYFNVSHDYLMKGEDTPEEKKDPNSDIPPRYIALAREMYKKGIEPDKMETMLEMFDKLMDNSKNKK